LLGLSLLAGRRPAPTRASAQRLRPTRYLRSSPSTSRPTPNGATNSHRCPAIGAVSRRRFPQDV